MRRVLFTRSVSMSESAVTPNSKRRVRVLLVALALTFTGVSSWFLWITQMPLRSYAGALPQLNYEEMELRDRLFAEVTHLSVNIGHRSPLRPQSLQATTDYLSSLFAAKVTPWLITHIRSRAKL